MILNKTLLVKNTNVTIGRIVTEKRHLPKSNVVPIVPKKKIMFFFQGCIVMLRAFSVEVEGSGFLVQRFVMQRASSIGSGGCDAPRVFIRAASIEFADQNVFILFVALLRPCRHMDVANNRFASD